MTDLLESLYRRDEIVRQISRRSLGNRLLV